MASPLEAKIKKTIHKAMKGVFMDGTLSRRTFTGATDPFDLTAGTPTTYTCKAIIDKASDKWKGASRDGGNQDESLTDVDERTVLVLADSLSVTPQQNDRITVRGVTLTVLQVSTDPAQAVWELRARLS